MNQQQIVLAGALAMALAGCSSWRSGTDSTYSSTSPATTASGADRSSGSSSSGSSNSGGSTATSGSLASGSNPGASTGTDSAAGSSGGIASASDTSAMTGSTGAQSQTAPSPTPGAAMPNATVALIEAVPRSGGIAAGSATGSTGGSSSGSTGAGTGEDRAYRITLRMDDGTTRVVIQDTLPGFRTGDRVSMAGGAISQ